MIAATGQKLKYLLNWFQHGSLSCPTSFTLMCHIRHADGAVLRSDGKSTCLRAPAMQALARDDEPLQLALFDERDLAEITAPDMFPGEQLIVCRNRDLAAERAQRLRTKTDEP
jgi:hypothetical protein